MREQQNQKTSPASSAGRKTKGKKSGLRSSLIEWGTIFLIAIVISFGISHFLLSPTVVEGHSMENTLHNQDRVLVWKLGVSVDSLKHGDIIVFHSPDDPSRDYIKRVIALPHEYVEIENGDVYVNGKRCEEDYINTKETEAVGATAWSVGENEVFVLGDNRNPGASRDSRYFGPIAADSIIGKAVFRFFPFQNMGGL